MLRLATSILLAAILAGCGTAAGSPFELTDGSAARRWGDGAYGVVLVHDAEHDAASWDGQARVFADHGMTVLAVEDTSTDAIAAGIESLHAAGLERVAVVAAEAGTEGAIVLGRTRPELIDQLILLSASADVGSLDVFPKLFVASEGAGAADARRMTEEARGDWNVLYLAPGDASGQGLFSGDGAAGTLEAVLQRLEERR